MALPQDTFDRPNQNGVGTASDGGTWTVSHPTLANIEDGKLQNSTDEFTSNYLRRDVTGAPVEYEIAVDIYRPEFTNGCTLVMGVNNDSYLLTDGQAYTLMPDSNVGKMTLNKKSGGTIVALAEWVSATWGAPSGPAYSRVTLRRNGAALTVIQDGTTVGTYTDATPLPETYWIGWASARVTERMDNFNVVGPKRINSPTSASVTGATVEPIPPATTVSAAGGAGEIVITWDSIPEADGYRLYKDGVQIADYPATYQHTDGGLGYSVSHSYYVITYNTAGDGPQSNVATATTYPDPLTPFVIEYGRRPYRLIVVDRYGTPYAELQNARIGNVTWSLNQMGSLTFDLPCDDPKVAECLTPEREVQCWRGDTLIWWGVLVRARGDDKTVNFQAVTLEWYFTRRVIGAVPNPNLLTNGSFETELTNWVAEYGNLEPDKTDPTKLPTRTIITSTVLSGTRAVELSSTLTSNHKWLKNQYAITNDSGRNITATCVAWSFLKSFNGQAAGEAGLIFARYDTTALDPHPDLAAQGLKKIHDFKNSPINASTPIGVWVRHELELEIPPDGILYNLAARLHVPNGVIVWDEVSIKTDVNGLEYTNFEQGYIFEELVTHAQDSTLGKSHVNILGDAPVTGVRRTRTYEVAQRDRIYDALNEFSTLHNGMDMDMEFTPTVRTLKGYFPRKGSAVGTTLALGTNILGFTVDVDAERTSTTVIVQAEGEGSDREEGVAQDPSLLNGLVLETVYNATPGSSVSSLQAQADRGLARYRRPVTIPSVTTHQEAGHLLSQVKTGDVVPIKISKGWVQVNALYRIVEVSLDPNTEAITYVVAPEDLDIKVLNDWGATGWKYFTQDQGPVTGTMNTLPGETNKEYAAPDFNDSTWLTGQAAIGWAFGTAPTNYQGSVVRNTEITEKHELWMRKVVACTGDMILYTRVDNFGYLYVNGNKIVDPYIESRDANLAYVERGPFRVPQAFLNPNGQQVIALHVQDKLAGYGDGDVFVGDVKVMGTLPDDYVAPSTSYADTFDRPDSATLGTTSDGKDSWTLVAASAIGIATNFAKVTATDTAMSGYGAALLTNARAVNVDLTIYTGDPGGLLWRYVDTNNFWAIDGAFFGYRSAGTYTQLHTLPATGARTLRVKHVGDAYEVYVDGVLQASGTSAVHNTANRVGFWGGVNNQYNDFNLTAL